jgi:hypothetical protein
VRGFARTPGPAAIRATGGGQGLKTAQDAGIRGRAGETVVEGDRGAVKKPGAERNVLRAAAPGVRRAAHTRSRATGLRRLLLLQERRLHPRFLNSRCCNSGGGFKRAARRRAASRGGAPRRAAAGGAPRGRARAAPRFRVSETGDGELPWWGMRGVLWNRFSRGSGGVPRTLSKDAPVFEPSCFSETMFFRGQGDFHCTDLTRISARAERKHLNCGYAPRVGHPHVTDSRDSRECGRLEK